MKKLFITIAAMSLLSACNSSNSTTNESTIATETKAESKADKLVGKWQLESVSGENLTETEKTATINYRADGTFTQGRGDKTRDGKWDFVDATSYINMTVEERNEPLKLISCDDANLIAIAISKNGEQSNDTLTLKRIN